MYSVETIFSVCCCCRCCCCCRVLYDLWKSNNSTTPVFLLTSRNLHIVEDIRVFSLTGNVAIRSFRPPRPCRYGLEMSASVVIQNSCWSCGEHHSGTSDSRFVSPSYMDFSKVHVLIRKCCRLLFPGLVKCRTNRHQYVGLSWLNERK